MATAAAEIITNLYVSDSDEEMANAVRYDGDVHLNLGATTNILLEYKDGRPVLTFVNPATGDAFFLTDRRVLDLLKKHL